MRTGQGVMKQIYYTQCPIGYGLGASNGFQIKRMSEGYSLSGDFRHLGLKAYIAGTRTMAPPALRYRRGEDGTAEVAWLAPRTHEYETERGLWGRPGGHFAHGLQLEESELQALGNWPAGLYDSPFWTRSDPVPSHNEPPEPRPLTPDSLTAPPAFATFETLDRDEDPELLARLLTCLADAVREGRTLFLIDEAPRLARRVGLLTLAFPASWRAALTFSTYHDRPEDLPGLRLQGTVPTARPNRPALLALGIVVDLVAGVWEPPQEASRWAVVLATWLTRRSLADRRSWEATERRALTAARASGQSWDWSDATLDLLYGLDALAQPDSPYPGSSAEWQTLSETLAWARANGLGAELTAARPSSWWLDAPPGGGEAWTAWLGQLGEPATWTPPEAPAAWGEAVAARLRTDPPVYRSATLARVLASAPAAARPGFVRAMIAALAPPEADELLGWLKHQPTCDRAMLLPLEVRAAVASALGGGEPGAVRALLAEALSLPQALTATLEALAEVARARPQELAPIAALLAGPLEAAGPRPLGVVVVWALDRKGEAAAWLGPYLKRVLDDPADIERWRALPGLVPSGAKARLCRVVLEVAGDSGLPDEAFRWGVEELLLRLPEAERPGDASWAGMYVDRTPSGLDMLKRLFGKDYRELGLKRWLDGAQARGELSAGQQARIASCEQYARILRTGDARALEGVKLPDVPAGDRGALLAQMLGHLGRGGRDDALERVLDACRAAWGEELSAGSPGLEGLGRALAEPLLDARADSAWWLDRLVQVINRLGLGASAGRGFEPDSLAAAIVAESVRRPGFNPWQLRQALLQNDAAWKTLAADVGRELRGKAAGEQLEALEVWDRSLVKGLHTARFFEVWLNACDGSALAATVARRAADLRTLSTLSWWTADRYDGARDDLREAFARLAPMAPIEADALPLVQRWLRPAPGLPARSVDDQLIAVEDAPGAATSESSEANTVLSPEAHARWRCLEALASIYRPGLDPEVCWQRVDDWRKNLPLASVELADRYRFIAWFILQARVSNELGIEKLAAWVYRCGVKEPDRILAWTDELREIAEIEPDHRHSRKPMVQRLWKALGAVVRDEQQRPRKTVPADSP